MGQLPFITREQLPNKVGYFSERPRPTRVLQPEMPSIESYQPTNDSKECFSGLMPTNQNLSVTSERQPYCQRLPFERRL